MVLCTNAPLFRLDGDLHMSSITSDRLYALEIRPQELSLYGEAVSFQVRYAPVADDLEEERTEHPTVLVVEASVQVPHPEHDDQTIDLEVLKIGWEATITTPAGDCGNQI